MTVQDFAELINAVAPFDTQMEGDNCGLLVGSPAREVHTVLFAMDATMPVIEEAISVGAELIVTHHPLMFSARRRLTDEDYEGRLLLTLARNQLSLIAAHTCLDQAPGGINDALAEACGLTGITGEGFIRCGDLPEPMLAADYARQLAEALKTTVRLFGPEDAVVSRLGVCSGGGSDEWPLALEGSCDAFLSGEIKHHNALAMADARMVAFECGHFATEVPGLFALADALQNALDTVQWQVRIVKSALGVCSFPSQP